MLVEGHHNDHQPSEQFETPKSNVHQSLTPIDYEIPHSLYVASAVDHGCEPLTHIPVIESIAERSLLESTFEDGVASVTMDSNPKNSQYCLDLGFLEHESGYIRCQRIDQSLNKSTTECFDNEHEKSKSKYDDLSLEQLPVKYSTDIDSEMLETFVSKFKKRRIKLGFTQTELALSLSTMYERDFSQTTICRFESSQLSLNTMRKMCPILLKWVTDTEEITFSDLLNHKYKQNKKNKKSYLPKEQRDLLDEAFKANSTPNAHQYDLIAKSVKLEKSVVRNWFCNKRQRERKLSRNNNVQLILISEALVN